MRGDDATRNAKLLLSNFASSLQKLTRNLRHRDRLEYDTKSGLVVELLLAVISMDPRTHGRLCAVGVDASDFATTEGCFSTYECIMYLSVVFESGHGKYTGLERVGHDGRSFGTAEISLDILGRSQTLVKLLSNRIDIAFRHCLSPHSVPHHVHQANSTSRAWCMA